MSNIANVLAIPNLLHQEVLTGHINMILSLDLARQDFTGRRFKLKCLDQLVLRGILFTCDPNFTRKGRSHQLAYDQAVTGDTGIVGMVIVLSVVCWFQIITTIEELANVCASRPFNDKLAARVIGCVVCGV